MERGISANDALRILGFKPGDKPTPEQLKAQYIKMARKHHPDSLAGGKIYATEEALRQANERMAEINSAMTAIQRGETQEAQMQPKFREGAFKNLWENEVLYPAMRRSITSQDQRKQIALQNAIDKELFKFTIKQIVANLNETIRHSFYKQGRPHVKIITRHPERRSIVVKIIELTASMLTAILGGLYIYNRGVQAWQKRQPPKLLTYQGGKRK